jgi:hypothetical protein
MVEVEDMAARQGTDTIAVLLRIRTHHPRYLGSHLLADHNPGSQA